MYYIYFILALFILALGMLIGFLLTAAIVMHRSHRKVKNKRKTKHSNKQDLKDLDADQSVLGINEHEQHANQDF